MYMMYVYNFVHFLQNMLILTVFMSCMNPKHCFLD